MESIPRAQVAQSSGSGTDYCAIEQSKIRRDRLCIHRLEILWV